MIFIMDCPRDMVIKLFDDKITVLEKDLKWAVKAGMPSNILDDEIDELKELKEEIEEIFKQYCKKKCEVIFYECER